MSKPMALSSLSTVQDFPDRLPAMLVKELRQGLRARLFAETAVGFHLLIMVIILPLTSLASGQEVLGIQRLVWWIFAAVLVALLPLRGLSALHEERQGNTMDTLLLTNLKAGRIVGGKWLAITSQILLVGLSVIPYILILYAGGGISLPGSLLTLARLILAGLTLTAAFVAFSWNGPWLQRSAPGLILLLWVLKDYALPVVAALLGEAAPYAAGPWSFLSELVAAAALITVLLEGTAQRLAPAGEDHQAVPRMICLLLPVLSLVIPDPLLIPASMLVITVVGLSALTEPWPVSRTPRRTWRRLPGLNSGWPHGVLWAISAWAPVIVIAPHSAPGLVGAALRMTAWMFCGFLLLRCGPAFWRKQAWILAATALMFLLLQLLLPLVGGLLNLEVLSNIAGFIPAPFLIAASDPPSLFLSGMAGGPALLCLFLAGAALLRHRTNRGEVAT